MSFPQGSEKDGCKRVFEQAVAAGISLKPVESKFSDKLFAWIKVEGEERKLVHQLTSALEKTLNRTHDDSRLVLALCVSLQEYSGLAMNEFLKKLERSIKFLDKPAAATVVKTIRQAAVAALNHRVIEIPDLDTIEALSRAPRDSIRAVEGQEEILQIGTEAINLLTSGKKEIVAAVRKVKAETKKAAPEPVPDTAAMVEESDMELDAEVSDELNSELDEAALALGRLLRNMPRIGRLSNLVNVIEQAQQLLELTRRDLAVSQRSASAEDNLSGSLN